jgi:fructose-specific phosphotransferase system IIC component
MAATRGSTVGALGAEPTAADRLFVALDQHRVEGAHGGCLVEVSGIHDAPHGGAWVQIAVVGDPSQNVVLYLAAGTAVDRAIAAVDAWGRTPVADRPWSINVIQQVRLVSVRLGSVPGHERPTQSSLSAPSL